MTNHTLGLHKLRRYACKHSCTVLLHFPLNMTANVMKAAEFACVYPDRAGMSTDNLTVAQQCQLHVSR